MRMKGKKNLWLPLILSLVLSSSVCLAKTLKIPEIASRYGSAIVIIRTDKGLGSSFLVTESGVLITNFHVLEGGTTASVKLENGDIYDDIFLK